MVKEVEHAKYLRVIISGNGSSCKDVTERLRKARKHHGTLHHFWRHTGLPIHWKLSIYNEVFVPDDCLWHGIGGPQQPEPAPNRGFPRPELQKNAHSIPSTCYTKVIAPDIPTTTNQQLKEQTSQPPLAHHIHRAQLKLFGHILRAPEQCLERNCCFTKAFVYRGGVVGEGLRRGQPRIHWVEQCAAQACHWIQQLPDPPRSRPPNSLLHLSNFTGWLYAVHVGVGSWGCQRAGNTSNRPVTVHTHSELTASVLRRLKCRCNRLPKSKNK